MKYSVMESTDLLELEARVQRALDNGWSLRGGVAVVIISEGKFAYFQAITKEV